jgi:hypothetical protein
LKTKDLNASTMTTQTKDLNVTQEELNMANIKIDNKAKEKLTQPEKLSGQSESGKHLSMSDKDLSASKASDKDLSSRANTSRCRTKTSRQLGASKDNDNVAPADVAPPNVAASNGVSSNLQKLEQDRKSGHEQPIISKDVQLKGEVVKRGSVQGGSGSVQPEKSVVEKEGGKNSQKGKAGSPSKVTKVESHKGGGEVDSQSKVHSEETESESNLVKNKQKQQKKTLFGQVTAPFTTRKGKVIAGSVVGAGTLGTLGHKAYP